MKKRKIGARAALCLCLLLALTLASCAGCTEPKPTAMQFGSLSLSSDIYSFWLCCYRAQFAQIETDENRESLATLADTNIRKSLIAAAIFDDMNLSLDAFARNQIEGAMRSLVDLYGSREALDEALAAYGIDYEGLRRAISYEQKAAALSNYLFGTGGVYEPSADERKDYYEQLYARVHIITILHVDFELDANGERIFDRASGKYLYAEKSPEALAAKLDKEAELRAQLSDGMDPIAFQQLLAAYNDDPTGAEYPNGYYFAKGGDYREYIEEIPKAALEMDVGTVTEVESEYGTHFLLRLPPADGAYDDEENKDFFGDFYARMQSYYFELYIAQFLPQVKVNYDVLATVRYEDCEPNFDIYW